MWLFYFCALLPVLIGAILLWKDEQVVWWEWLIGSASAFALAGLIHLVALHGLTSDIETWSGQITKVSHYPRWVEEYEEMHSEQVASGTDKDGNTTYTTHIYFTTEHATHYEQWIAFRDFGAYADQDNIQQHEFNEIGGKFGGTIFKDGNQSNSHGGHFDGGDNSINSVNDITKWIEPVTSLRSFENRVKAAPSVFSFSKVPTNINVYPWPTNPNWRKSDRLLGTAIVLVNQYKWDCLNSTLGSFKKVNLIMVGFGKQGDEYGHWQQAKWVGGKKNDLVITFGGGTRKKPAEWVYVFGWTENELVKKNIESLLMEYPINDDLIPLISAEVTKHYVKKDWHKFDYISIQPPGWSYWLYFILMILSQSGLYVYFHSNEFSE